MSNMVGQMIHKLASSHPLIFNIIFCVFAILLVIGIFKFNWYLATIITYSNEIIPINSLAAELLSSATY
jgi:hypothetical protein